MNLSKRMSLQEVEFHLKILGQTCNIIIRKIKRAVNFISMECLENKIEWLLQKTKQPISEDKADKIEEEGSINENSLNFTEKHPLISTYLDLDNSPNKCSKRKRRAEIDVYTAN